MTHQIYLFSTRISITCLVKELILLLLLVTNILPQSRCLASSSASQHANSKFGVQMVRSPEQSVAPDGDEVQFECELNLEPERLEWRFLPQDKLGDNQNDYIYMNSTNGFNVTLKDRVSKLAVVVSQHTVGEYQCIAWFGASALASLPAKLILANISLVSDRQSTGRRGVQDMVHWTVAPGNSVIIKCGEVVSYPAPVWSFYKDTVSVPSSVPQLPSGALILSPVTQRDSGTYYCSAVNSITSRELRTPQKTTLVVDFTHRQAPTFLSSVQEKFSAKPGSSIILECPGVGNPPPKPVWSRPRGNIASTAKILPYGLKLVDINSDDEGNYTCRLDNGISPALIHTVHLVVLQSPEIIEPPKASLTNESESLELECVAMGSPKPKIYWMINGNNTKWDPVIRTVGTKLFIESVQKRHAGIVQCFAKNDASETTASDLLRVSPKQILGEAGVIPLGTFPTTSKGIGEHPGKNRGKKQKHRHPIMMPPSKPSVTRLSDESVMVRWNVQQNEGLPIQFFKVQYRMLADPFRNISRSSWMTANDDIAPHVYSYEVLGLKPERFYRFRIAAVYSNNDNQLGHSSDKFLLLRGTQLSPSKSHIAAPKLTRIEPISETEIVLHWEFAGHFVEGFYAYYRAASTAGEYSKATVDGMHTRRFRIAHLESGTPYEFKLQSFTASAASEFSAILTGKTLKPATATPLTPSVIEAPEPSKTAQIDFLHLLPMVVVGCLVILIILVVICFAFRRRNSARSDDTENKTHPPGMIQSESNGYVGNHNHKLNGSAPRMNIIPNPLDQDGDKNRNIMELRFLPNTMTNGGNGILVSNNSQQSTPSPPLPPVPATDILPPLPQRRTLDRSFRNLNNVPPIPPSIQMSNGIGINGDNFKQMTDGDCGVAQMRTSSMRRPKARTPGSVPGSPRIIRGPSAELLHQNKFAPSPVPVRAHAAGLKRAAIRLGRADNLSSGSLNSIEV